VARRRRYSDDDEIDKSIREFQQGSQEEEQESSEEEHPPELAENPDEDTVEENETISNPSTSVREGPEIKVEFPLCSCCGAKWTAIRGKMNKPGCGCMIYKTCPRCGKCEGHCVCL